MIITKRAKNVWQIKFRKFGSCIYLLKHKKKKILIDTSTKENKKMLIKALERLNLELKDINIVILTHSHYDHTENIDLFRDSKIYANKKEFKQKGIKDIKKLKIPGIKIISTPGHSPGGICVYVLKEKILFSGDTLFLEDITGRTDLPESNKKEMEKSLKKLKKLNYQILCPGHISRNQLNKLLSGRKT